MGRNCLLSWQQRSLSFNKRPPLRAIYYLKFLPCLVREYLSGCFKRADRLHGYSGSPLYFGGEYFVSQMLEG